jgi:hypothetical protein
MTLSHTMTVLVFPSQSGSALPSGTRSPSTAAKALVSVSNVRNFCPSEKTIACLVWDVPAGFRYRSFTLKYKGANSAFKTVTGIRNPSFTLVGLSAGSTYQVQVTAVGSNGQNAPASPLTSFTTNVDKFNGVKNVVCARAGTTVTCRWANGANAYKSIKLLITCPPGANGKRTKTIIPAGKRVFAVSNVKTGACAVQFIPSYPNGRTGPKFKFAV